MAGSARSKGRETERQCAVTRERRAPGDLLRFVLDPEGRVVPDLRSRLPGRGVWLTCSRDILDKAVGTRAFDRGFRTGATVTDALPQQVDGLLERDALQRLSLANKAGGVVCGFDKVAEVIKAGKAIALVHASDAGEDGCEKLGRLYAGAAQEGGRGRKTVACFNREQLSLALGRPNVVHAALKIGVPAGNFLAAAARLDRFRTGREAENSAQVPETEEE